MVYAQPTDLGSSLVYTEHTHGNGAERTKKCVSLKNKQSKKNTHVEQNVFSNTAKVGRILSLKQSKKKGKAPISGSKVAPRRLT